MNFGPLQIATLWRLSRRGVVCNGLVVDGVKELRLIITEDGQIVHWERFPTAGMLRRRAVAILRERRRSGWKAAAGLEAPDEGPRGFATSVNQRSVKGSRRRRSDVERGLALLAGQSISRMSQAR